MNTDNSKPAKSYPVLDHDEYARSRPADDFWGQIKRTINGKPVTEEQISLIVTSIRSNLQLHPEDVLLDLACGNGALSTRLFDNCRAFLGVDLSAYLISVARKHHEVLPDYLFLQQAADQYVLSEAQPQRFSKVLCYGSFSYFSEDAAHTVLQTLFERFSQVQSIYIGNLPDRDRLDLFYKENRPSDAELNDHASRIGIWRSQEEFAKLASEAGWQARFINANAQFYAAHYRYDTILSR
ncbi:class I SAM-dependent methyltransferase [Janthinobacterium sp. RB2R34]|uniref:class I SAM-dependent methyltransferase n=1 Tax=Janthinobacterium sp. RB2R34 TaxID=3424193 RepID=UPI003F214AB3